MWKTLKVKKKRETFRGTWKLTERGWVEREGWEGKREPNLAAWGATGGSSEEDEAICSVVSIEGTACSVGKGGGALGRDRGRSGGCRAQDELLWHLNPGGERGGVKMRAQAGTCCLCRPWSWMLRKVAGQEGPGSWVVQVDKRHVCQSRGHTFGAGRCHVQSQTVEVHFLGGCPQGDFQEAIGSRDSSSG